MAFKVLTRFMLKHIVYNEMDVKDREAKLIRPLFVFAFLCSAL